MGLSIIFHLLLLKAIKGKTEEYYQCINPENTVNSPSDCTSIIIPDSDGYKCCSMKIIYEGNMAYNCLTLENKYAKSKETLEEYISKKSLDNFFSTSGGEMEIDCGGNNIINKNYERLSNEYYNCYKGHINGVEDEDNCTENDIPVKEKNKCCFVETSKIINNQTKSDKRCYIIKDEYFTEQKSLNNYLLDQLELKSLEQIQNLNITINCKNYDIFNFPVQSDNIIEPLNPNKTEDKSDSKTWIIVVIIISSLIIIVVVTILIIYCFRKRNKGRR